jgi:hypothetical protein
VDENERLRQSIETGVSGEAEPRARPEAKNRHHIQGTYATLSLRKADGTVIKGLTAQVSPKEILVMDACNPIEQGDMLVRTLPSGLRVGFIVDDPGYREALANTPACFKVKVRRAAPIDSLLPASFWHKRRADFEELDRSQRDALRTDLEHPKWLKGYCSRAEDDLNASCEVHGGLDSQLRSKFENLARQSAFALGCPPYTDPEAFWVTCLCLDLSQNPRGTETELLKSAEGGGFIPNLLMSSASYCSRLAITADRMANDRSMSAILAGSEFWHTRRSEFDNLLERQRSVLIQDTHQLWLKARFHLSKKDGLKCQREGGLDGSFISDFDETAKLAAAGLRRPPNFEPVEFWIYCLGKDLSYSADADINGQLIGGRSGGMIKGLLESSAAYCLRLAAKVDRQASETPSRVLGPTIGEQTAKNESPETGALSQVGRASARQAVVMPILRNKRWKRGRWATEAGVGKNSVYEYLHGKRNLSDENRKAMAEAIGLKPEELPD